MLYRIFKTMNYHELTSRMDAIICMICLFFNVLIFYFFYRKF